MKQKRKHKHRFQIRRCIWDETNQNFIDGVVSRHLSIKVGECRNTLAANKRIRQYIHRTTYHKDYPCDDPKFIPYSMKFQDKPSYAYKIEIVE